MLSRIYRIDFPDGYFYYGKTTSTLKKRLNGHKTQRIKFLIENTNKGIKPLSHFDIYLTNNGWNNPTITLIEELDVSARELSIIEQAYLNEVLNNEKNLNENNACSDYTRIRKKPTESQRKLTLQGLIMKQEQKYDIIREEFINIILENWDTHYYKTYEFPNYIIEDFML